MYTLFYVQTEQKHIFICDGGTAVWKRECECGWERERERENGNGNMERADKYWLFVGWRLRAHSPWDFLVQIVCVCFCVGWRKEERKTYISHLIFFEFMAMMARPYGRVDLLIFFSLHSMASGYYCFIYGKFIDWQPLTRKCSSHEWIARYRAHRVHRENIIKIKYWPNVPVDCRIVRMLYGHWPCHGFHTVTPTTVHRLAIGINWNGWWS